MWEIRSIQCSLSTLTLYFPPHLPRSKSFFHLGLRSRQGWDRFVGEML